jgi:hypothetical protein
MARTIHDLKQSRFLKKSDLGDGEERTFTIEGFDEDNVGTKEEPDVKPLMLFREIDKPMVMNWTNLQLGAVILKTENIDDWIGQRVTVWFDPSVPFGNKLVGGLRLKKPSAAAPRGREPGEDDVPGWGRE